MGVIKSVSTLMGPMYAIVEPVTDLLQMDIAALVNDYGFMQHEPSKHNN